MDTATNKSNKMTHPSSFLSMKRTTPSAFFLDNYPASTCPPIPNPAEGAEARRGLPDEVNSYRPKYSFMLVDKETNEVVMEPPGNLELDYLKKHFKPMFCRIDYTAQGKVATPAVMSLSKNNVAIPAYAKQLKEDELMLVEFNSENESSRDLVQTPAYQEGKYRGKSKYPGQADTDLSSELD